MNVDSIVVAFLSFVILDLIWFKFSLPMYKNVVTKVQKSPFTIRASGAIFAYFLMAIAVDYFVEGKSIKEVIFQSGLLGLVIYGVFNATNYTMFSNWGFNNSVIDTLWGTTVSILVGLILYKYKN